MSNIIIGNIIMFIEAMTLISFSLPKNKKTVVKIQILDSLLSVIGLLFLGGYTGAVVCAITLISDILCYKKKLTPLAKVLCCSVSILFSVFVNNIGIIGLLPLVAFVIGVIFRTTENIIKYKLLLIIVMALWLAHDIYIYSYISAIIDVVFCVTSTISILQIKKKQKTKNSQTTK